MIETKEDTIRKVDERMSAIVGEDLPVLKSVKEHVIASGGKRIRPLLHHYFAKILGYSGTDSYDVGAIGELIHAASLLHDDVVDDGMVRRGVPTPNAVYGNKVAVLAGDYLFSCALDTLAGMKDRQKLVPLFTGVIRMLSIGELIQMHREKELYLESSVYDRIIHGKTGSLFGAMLASAMILAGQDDQRIEEAKLAGERLGHIFQVRDDFLDYFGDEKSFGKELFQDFKRGIITRPIILLRDQMSGEDRGALEQLWEDSDLRTDRNGQNQLESFFEKYEIRLQLAKEISGSIDQLKGYIESHGSSLYSGPILKQIDKLKEGVTG